MATTNESAKRAEVGDGFLRSGEFAKAIDVREVTVLRWARRGVLPSVKLGRTVLIPVDALKRKLDKGVFQ